MRAIAEEAFSIVKEYKGSHSGEHGDGTQPLRVHEMMFGERVVRAFAAVKDAFDPGGLLNPGKIVRAPKMDDRSLFRYKPGYASLPVGLRSTGRRGRFLAATEMCNNNGNCRKFDAVMCPSYQATATRRTSPGAAPTACGSPSADSSERTPWSPNEMKETMDLCVGCKACRRSVPPAWTWRG